MTLYLYDYHRIQHFINTTNLLYLLSCTKFTNYGLCAITSTSSSNSNNSPVVPISHIRPKHWNLKTEIISGRETSLVRDKRKVCRHGRVLVRCGSPRSNKRPGPRKSETGGPRRHKEPYARPTGQRCSGSGPLAHMCMRSARPRAVIPPRPEGELERQSAEMVEPQRRS